MVKNQDKNYLSGISKLLGKNHQNRSPEEKMFLMNCGFSNGGFL